MQHHQPPETEKTEPIHSDLTISISGLPWLRSNPRLWLKTDIQNHQDLLILDGATITIEQAATLVDKYEGSILLDGKHLRRKEVSDKKNSISYGSVTGENYCITRYAVMLKDPIAEPLSWSVEGFHVDDGWVTLDFQKNIDDLSIGEKRPFFINTKLVFDEFRINLPAHAVSSIVILFYGREEGLFHIPYLSPPNDEFCWVATLKDIGASGFHEDVGDLGWSSVPASSPMWPSNRLRADGRLVNKADEPKLFAAIGHSQDKLNDTSRCRVDVSTGIFDGRSWGSDTDDPVTIEITIPTEQSLGYYSMPAHRNRKPKSWTVDVLNPASNEWVTIDKQENVTSEDYTNVDGIFYVPVVNKPDIESRNYRIVISEWNTGKKRVGLASISLYVHPADKFYLPTMEAHGRVGYVVRDNRPSHLMDLNEQGEKLKKFLNESNDRIDASIDKVNYILNNTQLRENDKS